VDENIYKAPEAELKCYNSGDIDDDLYIVSLKKFSILFISTLGGYTIYWVYKNWKKYNDKHQLGYWPVARAIFSIFFVHSLFGYVDDKLNEKNIDFSWNPTLLATIYVILVIFDRVVDRLPDMGTISLYLGLGAILLTFVDYKIFHIAQQAVNASQGEPDGASNSELTFANYFWIVLGLLIWTLIITIFLLAFELIDSEFLLSLFS